jgi:hypothetical protein
VTDAYDEIDEHLRHVAAVRAINARKGHKPIDRFTDIKIRITKRGTSEWGSPADRPELADR